MLSVAAATLANGGVCPISGRHVIPTDIVKKVLSVIQSAGMYDNAGLFTFEVGLPAKSGVAGYVMAVVPNLMGFATFSPRLDPYGNSVRGVSFCRHLVERFSLHVYDNWSGGNAGCKRNPRMSRQQRKLSDLTDLRWGIANGDRTALRVRDMILSLMVDISLADSELEAAELAIMENIYTDLIGQPPPMGTLESLASSRADKALAPAEGPQGATEAVPAPSPFDRLLLDISEQSGLIDDQTRQILFETAFRVACADGTIEIEEQQKLRTIAEALGINEGILEMEIETFRTHSGCRPNIYS
jgi:hypothetical protein